MPYLTKVFRLVKKAEHVGGAMVPQPVRLVDDAGEDIELGGGEPAAGSVTNAMLAGGITADKLAAGVIPTVPAAPGAATAAAAGLVKLAAVTPLVKAADPAQAAGEAPTKAEFDAAVALAVETKAELNALINSMRAAGQAASK